MELESILDDPSLRKTTFVLLHGGAGPYTHEIAVLLSKPNVYADFSEQDALLPARPLSMVIREWLEWYPEKVLYGTDLAPGAPAAGLGCDRLFHESYSAARTGDRIDRDDERSRDHSRTGFGTRAHGIAGKCDEALRL